MTQTKDTPRPFTLRLTSDERARLQSEAGGQPLGAYMRARLLEGDAAPRRMRGQPLVKDRQELGQALAKLGASELSTSLATLARAAHSGALPVQPETALALNTACEDVREMRLALFKALGLKPDQAPATLSAQFNDP